MTCEDNSTITKTDTKGPTQEKNIEIVSVLCHMSGVSYHLLLTRIATTKHPPSANCPAMNKRLVCYDPKPEKNSKRRKVLFWEDTKMPRGIPILGICSSTRSLQSTGKLGFCEGTHRQTHTQHVLKVATIQFFVFFLNKLSYNTCHVSPVTRKYLLPQRHWIVTRLRLQDVW